MNAYLVLLYDGIISFSFWFSQELTSKHLSEAGRKLQTWSFQQCWKFLARLWYLLELEEIYLHTEMVMSLLWIVSEMWWLYLQSPPEVSHLAVGPV